MQKITLKSGTGIVALAMSIAITGCAVTPPADNARTASSAARSGPEIGEFGLDLAQRKLSVKPGDDFFAYANGLWLDNFEIPADLSRYGMFDELRLGAEEDIRAIVESVSSGNPKEGSLERKVANYYNSWMDEEHLNALGAAPLKPHLDAIYAISDNADLMKAYANLHGDAPFGMGIIPDPADTTKYIAFLGQSGLGMPDRDYYLKDDERFEEYRTAYKVYITQLFTLAGLDNPEQRAADGFELEMKLAELHWSAADSRDIQKIYNPMPPSQLSELAPEIDWPTIMAELSIDSIETVLVAQPSAIDKSAELFQATPLEKVKNYLALHVIDQHAQVLSSDFDNAAFEFYGKTLRGAEEQRERWKRGVQRVNGGLGEAVGQIYVERHFPPAHRQMMEELVGNLTTAFEERLKQNPWMDEATREQAILKLSTFEPRIGYTDKWTDYTPLETKSDDLLGNVMALREFQWAEQVGRLGGPVDRQQWPYPPQTVNASYNPLLNQITFPAGILQPPFFDPAADPAVNYGAIGAVIGHEIGHGFDDQGRRFDEKGRIRDWWSEESNKLFQKRTDALGAQYDSYEPLEGLNVNGRLTMGENIGDLGGLEMSYAAYQRYLAATSDGVAPVIDGLTGDQRFFLGWAQVWRTKLREDALRNLIVTDPHSPPQYRVNGVVRNFDAWYEAFGVTEDDALYLAPEDRVKIW